MAQHLDEATERLGAALEGASRSIAVAESLTGGELSSRLACIPGSGAWFRGAVVAYAPEVKHSLLHVPPGPVVSSEAAAAMAEGAANLLGADISISVTGVAGPDEQDGQPPGTVWLGLHDGERTQTRLESFAGKPEEVVDATCVAAVTWLRECVDGVGA